MRKVTKVSKGFLSLAMFLLFGAPLFANPLIYQQYTADPTACWFNNRMYIYCSHDITGQTGYSITNVYLMSSDDLVNWTDEGIPVRASDTTWAGLTYAPDTVFRNGFYYIYYGNGGGSIGVFRGTSPTGPFTDPLGHSLVSNSTPGTNITYVFDPAAFIDDDGQAYLYFGGGGPGNARVIKLNSDMISVSGSAVSIDAPRYFEAPFMNKVNGTYYFSYSTDFSASPAASIDYMTSSNPMTGFTHRGTILNNPPNNCGNNDHAGIVNIGSNYYIAYHNRELALLNGLTCGGNAVFQRSVNLDRVFFNSDGTIAVVTPTTAGVAALKNQNPYSTLKAVMMAKESGLQTQTCSEGGMNITGITSSGWIQVRNLDFSTGATSFSARVAGTVSGGSIQVHLDSTTGPIIATIVVPNTGGTQTWQNVTSSVSGATGLHDVFFTFTGSGFNFESYVFTASSGATNTPTFTPTKTNTPFPPTATPTATRTPTSTSTATPIVASSWRVNAGGQAYTDSLGNVWSADENYSGGSTVAEGGAVTGTNDSTLYDTQRYGTFSYSFNVPAGSYQVTLKLAETYSGDFATGDRVFNIAINGTTVSSNLDIFAQVGSNTVDDKVLSNVSPVNGVITVTFTGGTSTDTSAVVEALQVIPMPPTPTMTRTNTPVPPTSTSTATFTPTRTNTWTVTPTNSATATAIPPTATFTFTSTSTATKTNTPVPPTNTFTAVPPTATRTSTPVPPTATNTSVPPTATSTNSPAPPTATFTAAPPTATFTAQPPTNTFTAVPPTNTATNTPVPPTVTDTPVPPTATLTNTPAPPTATFTAVPPTATFTSVPPTNTPTQTPVPPTATSTNTPLPPTTTFTAVPPTATRTATPVPPTATNTAVPPTSTPTVVTGNASFTVQLLSGVQANVTNSPHPQIQIVNTGTAPLALNNVTVKYWFNCDCTNQTIQTWVDWAGLMPSGSTVTGNIHTSVQATTQGGQTDAVVYSFTGNMVLQPGQAIQIQSRFNKSDWSNMMQSNDYSFAANSSFVNDSHATGYLNGALVWGQEPAATSAALVTASVLAFPNPSTGNGVNIALTLSGSGTGTLSSLSGGSGGEIVDPNSKITLKVYTLEGRLIWSTTVSASTFATSGSHTLFWDEKNYAGNFLANGVYLLTATVVSGGQSTTTKSRILILK